MIDQSITLAGKAGHEIAASVDGPELGLPVILAHGGGQTRRAWRAVAHRLARHGFRTIAVDMRGHGESAWARDGAYDISDFAADLVEIAAATASHPALHGASDGEIGRETRRERVGQYVYVSVGGGRLKKQIKKKKKK